MLNQTAMSSARRVNTLEGCVVMRSEVILSHVPVPLQFFFFFSFAFGVLSGVESSMVGGEPVCYIHLILHDVKNVS